MADDKKYYYLKLKDNFFDSEKMIVLENMQDGYLYSNILLKLYLRSLKGDGRLMFNDRIPYNSNLLAQITRHPVGVVEKALTIFCEFELIEVMDNGAIYMMDIQNFIGHSSTEADRQRAYQKSLKDANGDERKLLAEPKKRKKSNKKSNEFPTPEKKKELESELNKKKNDNKDNTTSRFTPPTENEISVYCLERKNSVSASKFHDFYESKGWMVGKNKMKDWKAAIRTWESKEPKNTNSIALDMSDNDTVNAMLRGRL